MADKAISQELLSPDRAAMLVHIQWLIEPVLKTYPDLRFEIAWGEPEEGPNRAKTFRFDQIDDATSFAVWINSKGCNVYLGATLKYSNTPSRGRTRAQHAAIATSLPIDIDGNFEEGIQKLAPLAVPQRIVITGVTPQRRGQAWIRIEPTDNMVVWSEINRRSVVFSGGDKNALGVYRLMRLAGSVSYPSSSKRQRGYVIERTAISKLKPRTYSLVDLLSLFPPADGNAIRSNSRKGLVGESLALMLGDNLNTSPPINGTNLSIIYSMLKALPSSYASDYETWLHVGFALHSFDKNEIGLELWKQFSHRCAEKAAQTDFEKIWAGFGREYDGRKISIGSLWSYAKSNGWSPPRGWDYGTVVKPDGA